MRTVFLGCYAPNAFKGLIAGSDRKAAIETLLGSVGGKLETMMFTRGEFDVMAISNFPDQDSAMGVVVAIHASGAFTKISVLEELDMDKVLVSAKKGAAVYTPAG